MLTIAHTALGISTGILLDNPAAAFAVGILTHHLADALPHFDPRSYIPAEVRRANPIHVWTARDVVFVSIDIALTLVMMGIFMAIVPTVRWPAIAAGTDAACLVQDRPALAGRVPVGKNERR